MQSRRHEILTILKRNGEATVDELATTLELTAVTVRHHLDILRADGLVEAPAVRRRHGPGRPQYVYSLTEASAGLFPQAYDRLTNELLDELKASMGPEAANELLQRVARNRLAAVPQLDPQWPMDEKLDRLTAYLTDQGFIASWEYRDSHYLLHASNCPYQNVASDHPEICAMDEFILERLVGARVTSLQRISHGAHTCIYQIAA